MDYDENWVKENKCFKSSNSPNNIRNQGTRCVQAYLHQIWKTLARLLTAISQWHAGAPKAILKTACLLAEITDSDIIQVPSKGQFRGHSQDQVCNYNFTFCWQRAWSQRRPYPERSTFSIKWLSLTELIEKMTTPLFFSKFWFNATLSRSKPQNLRESKLLSWCRNITIL